MVKVESALQDARVSGFLNIDKPYGLTSFAVVKKLRSKLKVRKIGHCGSLDPIATGVLVVSFGKATKKSSLFLKSDKIYRGVFKLGVKTDTDDITGRVLSERECASVTRERIERSMKGFEGEILQQVPLYSAVKVKGDALYNYARRGIRVIQPKRKVRVYFFKLLDFRAPLVWFEMKASSGAYVRALARDLGDELGCGAAVQELRRLAVGDVRVEQSLDLDRVLNSPVEEVLAQRLNFFKN